MKKLLLASAVAALSVSAANAAPTVYGKAFLTLDLASGDVDTTATNKVTGGTTSSSIDVDDRSQLNSNGSRIGLKGSEPITANTDVIYQLEYGVDVDANDNGRDQFYSRDTFLGLSNAQYGTVKAGRLTTIDDEINYANVLVGGILGGDDIIASYSGDRANNSIAYASPSYDGIQFLAQYVMDEDNGTDSLGRDGFGLAAKYEVTQYKAGVSYLQAGDDKIARISGSYDIDPQLTVGALYQMADFDFEGSKKENTFSLSGQMKTATPWTAYAQGDIAQNLDGFDGADAYRIAVGGKYAFNKATTGHIYGAYLNAETQEEDALRRYKNEYSGFGIGGGLEYKF